MRPHPASPPLHLSLLSSICCRWECTSVLPSQSPSLILTQSFYPRSQQSGVTSTPVPHPISAEESVPIPIPSLGASLTHPFTDPVTVSHTAPSCHPKGFALLQCALSPDYSCCPWERKKQAQLLNIPSCALAFLGSLVSYPLSLLTPHWSLLPLTNLPFISYPWPFSVIGMEANWPGCQWSLNLRSPHSGPFQGPISNFVFITVFIFFKKVPHVL